MERYSRGQRGHPAKVLVRAIVARVQIPLSPPQVNCTHPRENEKCVQFFFLHECFGVIIPFEKPNIENPSRLNWINLQVDFKIEVWIGIGITANKFLYENINAYD